MANPIQELLQAVYSCISDFNGSYARFMKAPREEWASMMEEAFSGLLSHHMEILRCSKVVADTTNTHIYRSVVPDTFTIGINTAADFHLKAMRNEVFKVMSEQLTTREEHPNWDTDATSTYSFLEDELRELSYLIPGQNGWVHVCPNSKLEGFLNSHNGESFLVELQVTGSSAIRYGMYKASIMPGQAMSGLEFAALSQNTRDRVARSLCLLLNGEQDDSPTKFREVMEDLLHSRISLACIFLECVQGPLSPNSSAESLSLKNRKNILTPAPAYLSEDALLPTRDSVPDYLASRMVPAGFNFSESESEIEAVDNILLDFSSISSRRWNIRPRRGSSPPPFGVIGDLRRPGARMFATSTPNVSDGVDDDDDDYYDDDDDEDEDGNGGPADDGNTPIAASFSYATAPSESQETSSYFSEGDLSYSSWRDTSEPLRPSRLDSLISRYHSLRLNSSFPGLSVERRSDNETAESSASQHKSESHVNYYTSTDIADEEIPKDFSILRIVEDKHFLRPSSALASIVNESEHNKGVDEGTSDSSVPDSPIWNTCRLRKMTSAPAIPRRRGGIVEDLNEKMSLNQSMRQSLNSSCTSESSGNNGMITNVVDSGEEGLKLFW